MSKRKLTDFDYILVLAVIFLSFIGILFIYSSGVNSAGESVSNEYKKQIIWGVTGLAFLFGISFYDYRRLRDSTFLIYLIGMLLLLYTTIFGAVRHNARSWIGGTNYPV